MEIPTYLELIAFSLDVMNQSNLIRHHDECLMMIECLHLSIKGKLINHLNDIHPGFKQKFAEYQFHYNRK